MTRKSRRVHFSNRHGIRLCGIVDCPESDVWAHAVFSHCFTCTKDLKAIVRISRRLAENGVAVLRFDFTGLGDSQGDFSETTFDDNCDDVRAAVEFLTREMQPPTLLIGHSLGGAAMMKTVGEFASVRGLTTIASPSSTEHLANYLSQTNPAIMDQGQGEVTIGGRTYLMKKRLIENLLQTDLPAAIRAIRVPHLIFHPDQDDTLPYWHAEKLFELTGGPKSMMTLHRADHLLVEDPSAPHYVADLIALWLKQHLRDNA